MEFDHGSRMPRERRSTRSAHGVGTEPVARFERAGPPRAGKRGRIEALIRRDHDRILRDVAKRHCAGIGQCPDVVAGDRPGELDEDVATRGDDVARTRRRLRKRSADVKVGRRDEGARLQTKRGFGLRMCRIRHTKNNAGQRARHADEPGIHGRQLCNSHSAKLGICAIDKRRSEGQKGQIHSMLCSAHLPRMTA